MTDEHLFADAMLEGPFNRDIVGILKLMAAAKAARASGNLSGTIRIYEQAVGAARSANADDLLSAACDNLGNALADAGRFDDALRRYNEGLKIERDALKRGRIDSNKARALIELGEVRRANNILKERAAAMVREGVVGRDLGIALDNAAIPLVRLGDGAAALKLLVRAQSMFSVDDLAGRAINSLSLSNVHTALQDKPAAAKSFNEAHDLAFQYARNRIDEDHYSTGFREARKSRLPASHEATQLFFRGIQEKTRHNWKSAMGLWQQAAGLARTERDFALALRIEANMVTVLDDMGQIDEAIKLALQVRDEASSRGLGRPEEMVTGTLGMFEARGADIHDEIGPLGAYARASVLYDVHRRVVARARIRPKEAHFETHSSGAISNELAKLAERHNANDLAARYFESAVQRGRELKAENERGLRRIKEVNARGAALRPDDLMPFPVPYELANRLAGLRLVANRRGDLKKAQAVADELTALLANGGLPPLGQLVARRSLAYHVAEPGQAIEHLQVASAIAEQLRRKAPAGPKRANVLRGFEDVFSTLARLSREAGDLPAAFEALQIGKGRRVVDALAARAQPCFSDAPPDLGEVAALLTALREETVLIDLAVEKSGITAYILMDSQLQAIHVAGDLACIRAAQQCDTSELGSRLVQVCANDRLLAELISAVSAHLTPTRRLLISPDHILNNLPIHIVPLEGRPWCDHFPIGYIPAAAVLRFSKNSAPNGRALVAGNSAGDLPHAAAECIQVAAALHTEPLLGQQCTAAAIIERLQSGIHDVIHFALHGRGDARRGGRGSILLADGHGGTEWVRFDELIAHARQPGLVALSGCSTGVAGPHHGHELVSVARGAVEAGAQAVIACLWPVGDQAAAKFMTEFYRELTAFHGPGAVDLRIILDGARIMLRNWLVSAPLGARTRQRNGRDFLFEPDDRPDDIISETVTPEAVAWAPFVLLGNPMHANWSDEALNK